MNLKEAYLTMGEYLRTTYPMMQQEHKKYEEQQGFLAAQLEYRKRKVQDAKDRAKRLDHSLNTAKNYKKTKRACTCKFCDERYYLITWEGRDPKKWPEPEGSCIFCVTLHLARIALLYGRDNNPYLINKLQEVCLTPYGKEWRKENNPTT